MEFDVNRPVLDRRQREVVQRIVQTFAPSMVLLFGSRARGEARPDSDVDLLVVWRDDKIPPNPSAVIRQAVGPIGFPMDLAVLTPTRFAELRNRRGHVVHSAARDGVVLHAA